MFKELLQGRPIRHPLHPALVHFPIGFFLSTLLLDFAAYFGLLAAELARGAMYTLVFGLVTGVLAGLAGFADRADIRLDHPSRRTVNTHMALNLTALGLFALNYVLRLGPGTNGTVHLLHLSLSLAGAAILLVSGYLGGTMVYDNGIGVGRHRRRTRTPRQTLDVSFFMRSDGWVAVCDEDQLRDGETLRVECEGNVIAIARQGGKVYAFQEFCTHRYGPLSEGKLESHHVICPWHLSCFDMRTGRVVEGPAKVDLKTYPAAIRDGKIMIR